MALFQNSVLKKHLENLDAKLLDAKWDEFSSHFLNPAIQNEIKSLKEEQYQSEFLDDLFVKILGYTKAPQLNFNLITEQKNQTNSKKADGAIIIDSKIVAVIELKGTETTDLAKIETQAFGYKNNQPKCVYVISSNFEKIRFYIENTVDFLEFNLFKLSREEFNLMYLCLSFSNIKQNIPKHLKDESVSKENAITKQLYKDYSEFKRALFNNLVELNPQYDKLLLFKKTQKLLDRFLFIFFAEDRMLLPTNLIRRINLEWDNLNKMRISVSLYERYKMYFEDLNLGAKVTLPAFGKNTGDVITAEFEIFAYNGGLFLPDEVLDSVQIDDDLLYEYSHKISDYDFQSEVDVNILGHIFENSLNEIDEIKKAIASPMEHAPLTNTNAPLTNAPLTISKRKKDGVFYTPKYITKYIVDNTIGKLCEEKKIKFNIIEEEFVKGRKNRNKTTIQKLDASLHSYRDWLLQIKICDPACGSGAFLNQALEFLIQEHKYIDDLEAKLLGNSIGFPGVEMHILENNLYGVDINDESVEIAKLSLWLRTAQKGRKLNSLNNNIKCGNSLIDDPKVAKEKAFSWEKEFPEVFQEKNKFAYHIVTSLHDSRTSKRMIDYKARERRFGGTKPDPEVFPLTKEEEELLAKTVSEIAKEDNLNISAFNICWDHMHILLICEEDEIPKIVQKIKSKTAREVNIFRGKTIVATATSREHAPLTNALREENNAPLTNALREEDDAPLTNTTRGEKQNSLWTQKFGCKPITTEEQYWNTQNYIDKNRVKHNLPDNPKLKSIIEGFVKSYEDCLKPEYKGGFDVVIGNPPYVQFKGLNYNNYFTNKCGDLYALFFEKSLKINKKNGLLSFITPSLFIKGIRYESLRNFLLENSQIIEISDLGDGIFQDVKMPTAITILRKRTETNQNWNNYLIENKLINKINKQSTLLGNFTEIMRGLEIGKDKVFDEKSDVSFLTGENIFRYGIKSNSFITNETYSKFRKNNIFFEGRRLIIRETGNRLTTIFLNDFKTQQNRSLYSIKLKNKTEYNELYLLTILNSLLIQFYYKNKFSANTNVFPKIRIGQVKELPIKQTSFESQQPFIEKAELMLSLNKEFQALCQKFQKRLKTDYQIEKLTHKLEKFYELSPSEFFMELKKLKIELKAIEKDDLQEYFETYKEKALSFKAEIDKTDQEIDKMVYDLYGLTEEEIKIVESKLN